jgi:hypothetical protein
MPEEFPLTFPVSFATEEQPQQTQPKKIYVITRTNKKMKINHKKGKKIKIVKD